MLRKDFVELLCKLLIQLLNEIADDKLHIDSSLNTTVIHRLSTVCIYVTNSF